MPGVHRDTDTRYCAAQTVVEGQTDVFVNSLLWAVEGDPDDHELGPLEAVYGSKDVYVNNILVICAPGDHAGADTIHDPPATWPQGKSTDVIVYGDAAGGSA